jgi:hypothetical protein
MKYFKLIICVFLITISCKDNKNNQTTTQESTSEEFIKDSIIVIDSSNVSDISTKPFYDFKVLDSKYIDASALWEPFSEDLKDFTESIYNSLKPFILEQEFQQSKKI